MAVTKYSYVREINVARFKVDYAASAIIIALDHIETNGTALDVFCKDALSTGDKTILDTIVTAHINAPLEDAAPIPEQRDSDGALITKTKITKSGRTYQARYIEFSTSEKDSHHSIDYDGVQVAGEIAMRFFDKSGVDITASAQTVLDEDCVMTEVDLTFGFSYDLFRGRFWILEETSEDCRVWCRMVPSVPDWMGGSKDMIHGCNVKYMQRKIPLMMDGSSPKEIINGSFPGPHFTKRFRHKPGQRVAFQLEWQMFK